MRLERGSVEITSVKRAEDGRGLIIRGVELAGDGKGGVAVTENAKKYRVLRVDTAAKTVGLYL